MSDSGMPKKVYVITWRLGGVSGFTYCPLCNFCNDDSDEMIGHLNARHVAATWLDGIYEWKKRIVGSIGTTDVFHLAVVMPLPKKETQQEAAQPASRTEEPTT